MKIKEYILIFLLTGCVSHKPMSNNEALSLTPSKLMKLINKDSVIKAAINDDKKTLKELLNNNPNKINIKDTNGDTALIWAALKGNIKIVNFLIKKGANLNIQDNSGQTALHAVSLKCTNKNKKIKNKILQSLIKNGGNVNIKTNKNMTPLMYAVECSYDMVQELVESGANVNDTGVYGSAVAIAERIRLQYESGLNDEILVNFFTSPLTYLGLNKENKKNIYEKREYNKNNMQNIVNYLRSNNASFYRGEVHSYTAKKFNMFSKLNTFILDVPFKYRALVRKHLNAMGNTNIVDKNSFVAAQYKFKLNLYYKPFEEFSLIEVKNRQIVTVDIQIVDLDTSEKVLQSKSKSIIINSSRFNYGENKKRNTIVHAIRNLKNM